MMRFRRSRIFRIIILVAAAIVILIGPWPAFEQSEYAHANFKKSTFARIENTRFSQQSGSLKAGWGEAEITPPTGVPLGGYSSRHNKANRGALEPLFVKAITVSNSYREVTIVSADFLLPLPELVDAVVQSTGLPREQIYFGATHTHSGPGGYGKTIIDEFTLGSFEASYFDQLTRRFTDAIKKSRENLKPVRIEYARIYPLDDEKSRLIRNDLGPTTAANSDVHVIWFSDPTTNASLFSIVTFNAHPTLLGSVNQFASGDYPAELVRELESRWHNKVLFMSSAPAGLLSIENEAKTQNEQRLDYAHTLADWITKNTILQDIQKKPAHGFELAILDSQIVPLDLPSYNYLINDYLKISPVILELALHRRSSYLHFLRVGDIVLIGYPADLSGELALSIQQKMGAMNVSYVPTSFNGDYIGYVSSSAVYDDPNYVTRDVNFFGKWMGDFLSDVSERMVAQAFMLRLPEKTQPQH